MNMYKIFYPKISRHIFLECETSEIDFLKGKHKLSGLDSRRVNSCN